MKMETIKKKAMKMEVVRQKLIKQSNKKKLLSPSQFN
jgi:hypothetical protein